MLLTNKPILYVCNVDEASVVTGNKYVDAVREAVKDEGAEVLVIGAAIEADIAELDTYEEKQLFLQDLGLEEAGVNPASSEVCSANARTPDFRRRSCLTWQA